MAQLTLRRGLGCSTLVLSFVVVLGWTLTWQPSAAAGALGTFAGDDPPAKKSSKEEPPSSGGKTAEELEKEKASDAALEKLMKLREQQKTLEESKKRQAEAKKSPVKPPAIQKPKPQDDQSEEEAIEALRRRAQSSTQQADRGPETQPTPAQRRGRPGAVGDEKEYVGPPFDPARVKPLPEKPASEARDERRASRRPSRDTAPRSEDVAERDIDPEDVAFDDAREVNDEGEWFNFDGMPWEDVIIYFAERIGKPLMTDEELLIGGELTYISDREFTQEEAIDELNLILHLKGYRFVEEEHHIYLIPLAEMPMHVSAEDTFPTVDAFEAAPLRPMDYVTTYVQIEGRPAQDVMDMFISSLPDYMGMVVEDESNQIKLTGLVRDIRKFLTLKKQVSFDIHDPREIRIFDIKTNARQIEQLVRDVLGIGSGTSRRSALARLRRARARRGSKTPASATQDDGSAMEDIMLTADERTNTLIVKATPAQLTEIERVIEELDKKPDIGQFDTTLIEIQHANATEVASLLNQIFQQEQGEAPAWQRVQQARRAASQRNRNRNRRTRRPTRRVTTSKQQAAPEDILSEGIFERAKKTVRIVPDERTNSIIVYANEEGLKRVSDLLEVIDKPLPSKFRTFKLEHADAAAIHGTVNEIAQSMSSFLHGNAPNVVLDAGNNALHVMAERESMAKVAEIIEELDIETEPTERHVVELENLMPSEVAAVVEQLVEDGSSKTTTSPRIRRGRRGRFNRRIRSARGAQIASAGNVKVIPLDAAQILIVFCPEEEWERIEETIRLWDERAITNTPELKTFTVEHGDTQMIASSLDALYRSYEHPTLGRTNVTIVPDGKQLHVQAIAPALEEIEALIASMDVADANMVEILPLQHADAADVAEQLSTVIPGLDAAGGGRRGRGFRRGGGGDTGATVEAEPVTNSLIVRADAATLERIKNFALDMDQRVGAQQPERRFYTMKYAQAREVASAIQQTFGSGGGRRRGRGRSTQSGTQVQALASGQQVVVEAPRDKFPEIDEFVKQMDDPQGGEIVIFTVQMPGADVNSLASRLNNAFREKSRQQGVTARFDPDRSTETILVTCSRDVKDEVEERLAEYKSISEEGVPQVEFRQMTNATAGDAARWLQDQLVASMTKQLGRNAAQQIRVTADPRTNRVIINAPQVAVKAGMMLLDEYDAQVDTPPPDTVKVETYKMPGVDVANLANQLNRAWGNRPRRPDGLRVSFSADRGTETLIVSAPTDEFDKINETVQKFVVDSEDFTPEQRIFQIEHADATYIRDQLQSQLSAILTRKRGRRAAQSVNLTVDWRLNRVMIFGPHVAVEEAEKLVQELDQPATHKGTITETIQLENADAGTLVNILNQIHREKIRTQRTLQITAEPMTNSVIVAGTEQDVAEIKEWANNIDANSTGTRSEPKIIELKNANPWEVVNILNATFQTRGWGRRTQPGKEVSFYAAGGRSVVIQAPPEKMAEIEELVAQLDSVGAAKLVVRTYELPGIGDQIHDFARQVRDAMNQKIGGRGGREQRVSVTPYPAADALIVTALPEQFEEVEEMMEKFRNLVATVGEVTTIFMDLEHVNAQQIVRPVQDMVQSQVQRERGRRRLQNFSVSSDPRTNRLIVTAPQSILDSVREVVAQWDVPPKKIEGELRVVKLDHVDAGAVVNQLRGIYQQKAQRLRDDKSYIPVQLTPDTLTNSILVIANDEDFVEIQKEVERLDVTTAEYELDPVTIELEYADPHQVSGMINQMFGWGRRQHARGAVTMQDVQVSVSNNMLVVKAPPKQLEQIRKLVNKIDAEDTTGLQMRSYQLKVLNAQQVAGQVQMFLRSLGGVTRRGEMQPGAFAEPVTNTLVVMAPADKLPFIESMITDLESSGARSQSEARSYVLRNARAEDVARNIDQMLQAKVQEREGSNRRSTVQTRVFADGVTNRLFVYAPAEYQELAADMIDMVDTEVEITDTVRIMTLERGNAEQIARSVQQVIEGNRRGSGTPGARSGTATVRITADASSNSILLSGMPKDVAEVQEWIRELEAKSQTLPELKIFRLEYANALDVADALQSVFAGTGGGGRRGRRGGVGTDAVNVQADEYYNRILVTANERRMREVEDYLAKLDTAPEQRGEGLMDSSGRRLYFVDINRGDAFDIAFEVSALLPPEDRGGPVVDADWYGRYLTVRCRPGEFEQVEDLIREFERRQKVEMTAVTRRLRGNPEQLLDYLEKRSENVDIERLGTEKQRESLIIDLHGDEEKPAETKKPTPRRGVRPASDKKGAAAWPRESHLRGCPVTLARDNKLADELQREIGSLWRPSTVVAGVVMEREADPSDETPEAETNAPHRRRLVRTMPKPSMATAQSTTMMRTAAMRIVPVVHRGPSPFRAAQPPAEPQPKLAARAEPDQVRPPAATPPRPNTGRAPARRTTPPDAPADSADEAEQPVEREKVRVIEQPDGSLILIGPEEEVNDVEDALDLLEEDLTTGEVIRIFKFRYGDVTAAAEVLNIMFNERQQIRIPRRRPQQRGRQQGQQRGQEGRQGMMDQLGRMIGRDDDDRGRDRAGQQVRIATDPGHNYLIVKCDASALPDIRQLLRELDIPPGEVELEVFQLDNLDAAETAENIKDVLGITKAQSRRGRSSGRGGRGRGQQQLIELLEQQMVSVPGVEGGAKVERVEIVPNEVTNSLMVSAPPEVMGIIANVINELEGLTGRDTVGIHHYELRAARLEEILPLLQEIFEGAASGGNARRGRGRRGGGGTPSDIGPVTISGDPRKNTIIFTCQAKDEELVREQIAALDVPGAIAEAESYVVEYGDAAEIADVLNRIYGGAGARGSGRRPGAGGDSAAQATVRIEADPSTNTVLIWGPPEKRGTVIAQIAELDHLSDQRIREIDILYADPSKLAEQLMAMFGDGQGASARGGRRGRGRRGGGGPTALGDGRVVIMGDKDAKKLLVRAPDHIFLQIESLVETLDKESEQLQIKRFVLKHAIAEVVVDNVKQAMQEFVAAASMAGSEVDFDAFTAVADPRTNSVVVVGSPETFLFVSRMLAEVDVETPDEEKKAFRVFLLEKADAMVVAETINDFAAGGGTLGAGGASQRRGRGRGRMPRGPQAGGARELDVFATAEEATNSVMVYGKTEDINLVEAQVIQPIEESIRRGQIIETIPVENAPASQVAGFIGQLLGQREAEQAGRRGGRRGPQPGEQERNRVQIIPNDEARLIVARGTQAQIDEVRDLVQQFDDRSVVTNVKVIPIPAGRDAYALASEVERVVNEGERQLAETQGRDEEQVTIGVDEYTNALIVYGSPRTFGTVETVVGQLANIRKPNVATRIIQLSNLSATDAMELIEELQSSDPGGANRRGGSGVRRGGSGSRRRPPANRGRGSRRRGTFLWDANPMQRDAWRAEAGCSAWLEPFVSTIAVNPMMAKLTVQKVSQAVRGAEPDQPRPTAKPDADNDDQSDARKKEIDRIRALLEAARKPQTEAQPRPAQSQRKAAPPAERAPRQESPPSAAPASEDVSPPAQDLGDPADLTGVSGSLRGEVAATELDSRRIIISGDEEDLAFIEQILSMMEHSAPRPVVEVFNLANAKATALQPILSETIEAVIDVRTDQRSPADRFSISAEAASNSLIVSASEENIEIIAEIIEKLDVSTGEGTKFIAIPLEHLRAADAVEILTPAIEKLNQMRDVPTESQASIEAIDRSNSVLIIGTPKDITDISELVATVDVEIDREDAQASFVYADVILVQLKNGQAEDIAQVLTEMIESEQEAAKQARGGQDADLYVGKLRLTTADGRELPELNLEKPIRIIPEKGTNSLLIYSTPENNEALVEIVGVFDSLPLGEDTDVRAFVLQYANAEQVAELLESVFEDGKEALKRPTDGSGQFPQGVMPPVPPGLAAKGLPYQIAVAHEERSNTVVVVGRKDAVLLAGGLISELDRPSVDLGYRAYVLELKNTNATNMAETLNELLEERAQALGGDQNEARDSAVVVADDRTSSLIVMATDEVYNMVEGLVSELDAREDYRGVSLRYLTLQYADAQKLANLLQEVFDKKKDADPSQETVDSLFVLPDVRSNSLVMTGTRNYLEEAATLIADLDKQFDPTVEFRIVPIRLNSAANVATLLKDMVDEALQEQDSALEGSPIHIAADPLSQSLLLAASHEDLETIERWVEILDRPNEVGRMTQIIPLHQLRAEDMSNVVEELFQSQAQGDGEVDISVIADETTNSVVVFAPPALLRDIASLVREMDNTESVSGTQVKIFKLDQADAEDAGELLNNILELRGGAVGGRGGGGGGARQDALEQVMLIYQEEHPELGQSTLKGLRAGIVVISDIRTNSLVVTAPPESMGLVQSLIAAIDVPPDAAKIRLFKLRNADAEQMVEMLNELFEERQAAGRRGGGGGDEGAERELVLGEGLAGIGGRQEISFTVDVRTNSVVAAGTPGYLDLFEELILELDAQPIEERKTVVYAPRNIVAADLATSISEFSDQEQSRLQELGEDLSLQRRQEREIVAISNEEANRVILSYSPRFESEVLDIVRELDQPPPQVMIQVLIIEVTMDNSLELGVEFAFQDLQYTKAGPTDTTTFDFVGGTDIGAAGSGLGGFTFTVTGADFNFLIRTLQNQGNLQVLSRPQIVAMDNQTASIQVTDNVPYVSGTAVTTGGNFQSQVAREDVGIVLEVTPHINPDGFVRLEVLQEVSDITDSSVDIGNGITSPIFFERRAETVITVKDNETVVIGGLITSRSEDRTQKVPLVGDIPVLGTLFRNQREETRRTELLLVLTPRVIRTIEEYREYSIAERDREGYLPPEVLASPLMNGLQVRPEDLLPSEEDDLIGPFPENGADDSYDLRYQQGGENEDDMYGPVRPAQRNSDAELRRRESYDIPITSRAK